MITSQDSENEKLRLRALESYDILDTLPEKDYDNLTSIAAEICGTPISLVSLIDNKRQWFKSHHGIDVSETPKEYSFCIHAIKDPNNTFIIEDARKDDRFKSNPLVVGDPHVIFYAGVPLISDSGQPLGTLCVVDYVPRVLTQNQLTSLNALADQLMNILSLRKSKLLLENALSNLEEKNKVLERFAYVAAHDLRSPLINISSLTKMFMEEYGSSINANGQELLTMRAKSSDRLRLLIDGLLEYSLSESVLQEKKVNIKIDDLRANILNGFNNEKNVNIVFNSIIPKLYTNKMAIELILMNLCSNSIKYSDKNNVEIKIDITESATHYEFAVTDNGPGIITKNKEDVFGIFKTIAGVDKYGRAGNGIGLATVKRLIVKSGGMIDYETEIGKGTKFIFTIEK